MGSTLQGKRVLVTGVKGQVGRALAEELAGKCELVTAARNGADLDFDLENLDQIRNAIADVKPDFVINPAAYTKVDQAEDEPELTRIINGKAPGVMAEACKAIDALLVHYSTDYVFPGDSTEPYTEEESTGPINMYGQTKLEGELAIQEVNCRHLIFRTCWIYDADGRNFVNAILGRARKMRQLKIVNDQLGTPTSAAFIARITQQALEVSINKGMAHDTGNRVYNLCPDGYCSWYDFACHIIDKAQEQGELAVREVLSVDSNEFPTKAKRPNWSVLANGKLIESFGLDVKNWAVYADQCLETR